MAASVIAYTPGSGGKAHAESITIGANTGDVSYVLAFPSRLASYVAIAPNVTPVAADHALQLMAGSALGLDIREIHVEQGANVTTAAATIITVVRLTSAGTGGTGVTPAKLDNGDSAAGATAMTMPTAKGTEGVEVLRRTLLLRQAVLTTAAQQNDRLDWVAAPGLKGIVVPSGTANGIAIKTSGTFAGGGIVVTIEFCERNYV